MEYHLSIEHNPIPVIDLFAGPGGLGEGFASLLDDNGLSVFRIALSIEMDEHAHRTLRLRALYRQLKASGLTSEYWVYVDDPSESNLDALRRTYPEQWKNAEAEAWRQELCEANSSAVSARIRDALGDAETWVLVGGPPCQAYSIVGRARRADQMRDDRAGFEADPRHTLYRYYLDVIREFKPTVFVMENVKGLLSATVGGTSIFDRIRDDLSSPDDESRYAIKSLVKKSPDGEWRRLRPEDYVIHAEKYGVPQARHRVILLGTADGLNDACEELKPSLKQTTVEQVISDLPPLSGRVSLRAASEPRTRSEVLAEGIDMLAGYSSKAVRNRARAALERINAGNIASGHNRAISNPLRDWYGSKLDKPLNHEARSHMESDLQRYFFCAAFSKVKHRSPVLADFPESLLPAHKNVRRGCEKGHFADRFRVQLEGQPSKTITSHISKDGHYYIHPDPVQCRSLSVREAARLQTFPDDYFFEGNRTQQYHQVGNAVPPFLAQQIAGVVARMLGVKRPVVCEPDYGHE